MIKNERTAPNSEWLRSFVVIAECGNLTHAAERLNKTQSAVSVQLRKLEDTLGVSLFKRHVRGMALSESGEKLLPAARRALAELRRTANLFDHSLTGCIRVGIPDDFDDTILEFALAAFSERNPDVEIITVSGCTSGYAKAVERGELDVAVCSGSDQMPGIPLPPEPTVWASSSTFVFDHDAPVPLALLDRDCWWRTMPARALEQAGRLWKYTYKSESFSSLRAAIRAGLAVGALPMGSVTEEMRILSDEEQMPLLPSSMRGILIGQEAPTDLAAAMANALRNAVVRQAT